MDFYEYNEGSASASRSPNLTNSSDYRSKMSGIVGQAHSLNTLHLMAGFCQIFLGLMVVLVSVLGIIRPLWLSTILSMFASVVTMLGVYFLYSTVRQIRDPHRLLENAIRRVVNAQN